MQILMVAAGMSLLSGEDRRLIELGKRWIEKGHRIDCLIPASSLEVCQQEGLKANFITFPPVLSDATWLNIGVVWTVRALAASVSLPRSWRGDVVYSRSRLYPDLIPAWLLKRRHRDAKWIVSIAHWIQSPSKRPRGDILDWVVQLWRLPARTGRPSHGNSLRRYDHNPQRSSVGGDRFGGPGRASH